MAAALVSGIVVGGTAMPVQSISMDPASPHTQSISTSGGAAGPKYALPSDRTFVWNPGLMSKGGIQSAHSTICNSTPLLPSGTADASARINAAISRCPSGGVVLLGAGTFLIGKGEYVAINKGIVLRGAAA